jgi:hypothetical protein
MRTFIGLFLSSTSFGVAIAIAYYFVAHEETVGTILLSFMGAALAFCAGYAIVAERNADLEADKPAALPQQFAGEDLGIFTTASAWPILIALCALGFLTGLLWSPLIAALALIALILCLWRLGAESARV